MVLEGGRLGGVGFDFDGFRLGAADGHTLVLKLDFERIAQRGNAGEADFGAGQKPERQKTLFNGALRI
jgi:hypothetical protein